MNVTIWSNGCVVCEQAKSFFRNVCGYERVRIVEFEQMTAGKTEEDNDALTEITMDQDGAFPLVKVDGVRIPPRELHAMLTAWEKAGKPGDWPHEWPAHAA